MPRPSPVRLVTLVVLLCAASHATAQTTTPPPPGTSRPGVAVPPRPPSQPPAPRATAAPAPRVPFSRGVVFVDGLYQPGTASFSDHRAFTANREPASLTSDYSLKEGLGADAGLVLRVWRGLGVGLAVSHVSRDGASAVAGSYPHPFFFNQARTGGFDAGGMNRTELGTHVSLAWMAPASRRLRLVVFAGPSVFSVSQTVVDTPTLTDVYPYDTIALAAGTARDVSETMVGVHGGLDATWYFSRRLGAGLLARYATASTSVSVNGGDRFDLEAGGVQIGLGLRLKF